MTRRYRLIDHTADFGLEIFGPDAKALFETAASALFELITDTAALEAQYSRQIQVTGDDWPDLMVNWLRELLYLFNGEQQVVCRIAIKAIDETELQATVGCRRFTPRHHEIRNEIKAVTYHQIEVGPGDGGWRAQVIFDV